MTAYSALAVATAALALLTAIPFSRHEAWWIRGLDFPRLQLSVMLLSLLAAQLIVLDPSRPEVLALIAVVVCSLAVQAWWIIPYSRIFPVEVKSATEAAPERTIRIMTANVLTSNHNAQGLLELVRQNEPDILVTLESDSWWQARLDTLAPDYPFTIKCPLDNLYGMHVYSRLPLHDATTEYLVEDDVPSMHASVELRSGDRVRMHFLHPAPPSPQENDESSERDAELLLVARSVARSDTPAIVTGDLNDVAWSETTRLFRKISGMLDPRIGRGMFNTFHAGHWFMRWPLDHLFHSDHFVLVSIRRLPGFGSDHFPLLTELLCAPHRRNEQDGLESDADDHALATEKIRDEGSHFTDVPEPGKPSPPKPAL